MGDVEVEGTPWARLHIKNGVEIRTSDLQSWATGITEQGAPHMLGDTPRDRSSAGRSHESCADIRGAMNIKESYPMCWSRCGADRETSAGINNILKIDTKSANEEHVL